MAKTLFFRFFVFAGLMGCLLVAACNKDETTIIEGIVSDVNTGLPLKDVAISYAIYFDWDKTGDHHDSKIIPTDINGNFHIEYSENDKFTSLSIYKKGYKTTGFFDSSFSWDIKEGEYNQVNITLIPE